MSRSRGPPELALSSAALCPGLNSGLHKDGEVQFLLDGVG